MKIIKYRWSGEKTQCVRKFAANDLSWIPGSTWRKERIDSCRLTSAFYMHTVVHICASACHTYTHRVNKNIKL